MERFWSKVEKTDGCWIWIGGHSSGGYGCFRLDGKVEKAHRVAYRLAVGEIPLDYTLDHLCRTRSCVRPDHLEPVTAAENTRRGRAGRFQAEKTHCPQGHPYSGDNLFVRRHRPASRECRTCMRANLRASRARRAQ